MLDSRFIDIHSPEDIPLQVQGIFHITQSQVIVLYNEIRHLNILTLTDK